MCCGVNLARGGAKAFCRMYAMPRKSEAFLAILTAVQHGNFTAFRQSSDVQGCLLLMLVADLVAYLYSCLHVIPCSNLECPGMWNLLQQRCIHSKSSYLTASLQVGCICFQLSVTTSMFQTQSMAVPLFWLTRGQQLAVEMLSSE